MSAIAEGTHVLQPTRPDRHRWQFVKDATEDEQGYHHDVGQGRHPLHGFEESGAEEAKTVA